MVQLKYFGDSRDYFKYDLMTSVIEDLKIENYAFIPMLTNHRVDNEGNKLPKIIGGKSADLLSFIGSCGSKSLCHWEKWLCKYVKSYKTLEPVNKVYFVDNTRDEYWVSFATHLKEKNALIFLDPDTGLESGTRAYLSKMGREKYILNHEIELLYGHLDPSSILMIYQHLPNNKHIHEDAVLKKLMQLKASNGDALVCGYREDDLVFLFMAKDSAIFNCLCISLTEYHEKSEHRYKSLHLTPNERLHSDGLQPFCNNELADLKENFMPAISMFFGIIIRMFYRDNKQHHLPHIHAEYQGEVAVFAIRDGSILAGSLPISKQKLVEAWIEIHRDELFADWQLAVEGETVFKIKGLE